MSRSLLIWCPDWPVIAAELVLGVSAHEQVAIMAANRVLACSESARVEGVRRGLRKREAQGRCPGLTVIEHDPGRDAQAFEPVVAAVEEIAPGVEVVRPGACALAARGPTRYFGSEAAAAERIVEHVAQSCGVEAQVGAAEGVFAAGLAARVGRLVPPGGTPAFLADLDIAVVDRPDLVSLLRRLGIQTLGAFAALPAADVLARFGMDAALVHRAAAGLDERPLAARRPPPDLDVTATFDEPLERVDTAAFAARHLAQRLHDRLAAHGLACTRLGILAVTEGGAELYRSWRHDGLLTAAAIADRLRWQLDGWLTNARRAGLTPGSEPSPGAAPRGVGAPATAPSGGIVRLRLVPDGVIEHAGLQLGLWGDAGEGRERAHRALTRIQGLLGPEAAVIAVPGGGRGPGDQIRLVPWGDEPLPARPGRRPQPAAGETPSGPQPIGAPPPVDKAPRISALRPVGQARETPAGETPARETPAGETPARETPAGETPAGETPAGETPAREAVVRETFARELPAREAFARETQARDAGARGVGGNRSARGSAPPAREVPPWPGRLPAPSPACVLDESLPVEVLDAVGAPVRVSARLVPSGEPTRLVPPENRPGAGSVEIVGWAGPWPVDERWWAPDEANRRARFQVLLADGRAMLLALAAGQWLVEALYE